MGRKGAAVIRSRKNTLNRVEHVKNLLVNSGIGNHDHSLSEEWNDSTNLQSMSRTSSVGSDEIELDVAGFDDTHLVTSSIYSFITMQLIRSRLILLIIQTFFNWLISDFGTDAFKSIEPTNNTRYDIGVNFLFGGLARWDSRHFLHIAEFGYSWESTLAFFPFFPSLLRIMAPAVQSILIGISTFNAMIFGGVLFNNALFVVNGILLFKLCLLLTKSTKESLLAVYIFCFNPASIFFSSLYTETVYMSFVLLGLIVLYKESDYIRLPIAATIFAFAYLTRANGFLNIGYIAYPLLIDCFIHKDADGRLKFQQSTWTIAERALKCLPLLITCALIVVLPLRIFGWSMEEKYCGAQMISIDQRLLPFIQQNSSSYVLPGKVQSMNWCRGDRIFSLLAPAYYSEIQNKYWGVGFFNYWHWKKIPMFIMASPTLGFVLYGAMDFLFDIGTDRRALSEAISDVRYLIPFILHSSFIALSGVFIYNVEVSMRMLYSSSPFIYILIARIMSNQTPRIKVPDDLLVPTMLPFFANYIFVRPLHFLMMFYILGYFFFGTLMHVNWLPFV